tara:strand:+ start:107 stop:769 length:663 start_codon:yes stop_codon:yes gene_type:complete
MTDNAKTALAALRASSHPLGRPVALCLTFEPANDQCLAASIFDLAIALDSALHIPSESLLAAIRVQWWADALSNSGTQTAPLITQLQSQLETHDGLQSEIIALIGHWQTACYDENRDNIDGWVAVWALVAKHMGQAAQSAIANDIGHQLHHAIRGHELHAAVPLDRPQISALRRNNSGQKRSFLYLAACWLRYVQRPNADANHPALVWKMLAWQLFGPPQ